jgi:PBSX family phage terminase large subunit
MTQYMILTPAQSKIAKDTHRFRVLNCGRRFGKTTLAIWELLGKALAKDDTNLVYIAPTYQQARDIAWRDLIKICEPVIHKINESRLEITINTTKGGTARISFRGWESIETLRGQRYDFIVIDEVAMMRDFWLQWQEVIRPTLTDSKGECLFISTPKGFNHFYDLYNLEGENDQYKSFHFTSYDNTHIPKEEIDEAKLELTEDSFAQEYMADFRKQEGLVYKEFSRDRHVFDELPTKRWADTLVGLDFGYNHPAAVLTIQKDVDGSYWVTDEWYKTGKTDAQIAEYAASVDANKYYPDPASPGGIKELTNKGLNVIEVVKGKGSVLQGIDRVRQMFMQNRLHISNKCINLISELETYHYEDTRANKTHAENPAKEGDDACDALRYAVVMNDTKQDMRMRAMKHDMLIKRYHSSKTNQAE